MADAALWAYHVMIPAAEAGPEATDWLTRLVNEERNLLRLETWEAFEERRRIGSVMRGRPGGWSSFLGGGGPIPLRPGPRPSLASGAIRRTLEAWSSRGDPALQVLLPEGGPSKPTLLRGLDILCEMELLCRNWKGKRPVYKFARGASFEEIVSLFLDSTAIGPAVDLLLLGDP